MAEIKKPKIYTSTEAGVVNHPTYPDELQIKRDIGDADYLANMWNRTSDMWGDHNVGTVVKTALIVKVIHGPSSGGEHGYYVCAVEIPEWDMFTTVEKLPKGVESNSNAMINLKRRAEGYLEAKPQIGQECLVEVAKDNDTSYPGKIFKLGNLGPTPGGVSEELADGTSAQDAVTDGGSG